MSEAIFGRIAVIVRDYLELPASKFTRETSFKELVLDPLDRDLINDQIADEFDCHLSEAATAWATLGDLADELERIMPRSDFWRDVPGLAT